MSDIKKYLSLDGLTLYHNRIKGYIDEADKNLSGELALLQNLVGLLDAKLGDWGSENSDSDFVSVESAIAEIKDLIENIRKEGGENDDKIEESINGIEGELEGITTAIEKLNGEDTVEGSVKNIAKSYAEAAQEAAEKHVDELVKDAEGNVKFDEKGAAAAAETAAKAYADRLADNYDPAGAAEQALAAAKNDAATLYQVKGDYETAGAAADAQSAAIAAAADDATEKANAAKESAIETAAADATEKADAAQAAAIATAATDAQEKATAAQTAAIAAAKEYVDAIPHAFDLKYEGNIIKIIDEKGGEIGDGIDASAFVTEGILKDVDFAFVDGSESDSDESNNTTLRLTFDTDNGEKVIDIDFSNYVDIYRADNSSIALDSITNTFSVKNVEATKTKTVGKIPVAGGPLAKLFENAGIDVSDIAAGSSVEDIFMSLLCKELWPESIVTTEATLTSHCANPTVTLNGKTSGSSDVEVGTSVAYSVSSGKSSYTATPHTASNLEYGYSVADDDSVDFSDTTNEALFGTISAVEDSVPKLTLSGLVSETVEGTAGSAAAGAVSTSGNVVIEEGEKTLSAYGTSIRFIGTCSKLDKVYGCSNLGKTNNDGTVYTSTEKAEITKTSTAINSGTTSVKCVGKYKYFIGYSDKTTFDQFDSASVRSLTTKSNYITVNGTTTPVGTTAIESNGKSIIVAVPNKYKLSTIENGVGASILSNFSSVGEVSVTTGTLNTTYTVYVYPITNGAVVAFKNVTITKA